MRIYKAHVGDDDCSGIEWTVDDLSSEELATAAAAMAAI